MASNANASTTNNASLHPVHVQHHRTLRPVHPEQPDDTLQDALVSTSLACMAAAALTYPISQWDLRYQTRALAAWADKDYVPRERSQFRRVLSPMSRLILQEVALQFTERYSRQHYHLDHDHGEASRLRSALSLEMTAGGLSGIAHALLLCPLAAREARERQKHDLSLNARLKRFSFMVKASAEGATPDHTITDPADRLKRAYRGITLLAVREVVFNVTFFPLSFFLMRYVGDAWLTPLEKSQLRHVPYYFSLDNLITWRSNVVAGAVCSLLVAPMDVLRTYYWHSGEQWTIWKGRSIVSPPWSLLFRGWTVQALVMGPAFGTVATIYEWKYWI